MNTIRLANLAWINPRSERFERLAADDQLSFLPMEGVWPDELQMTEAIRTDVEVGYTRFEEGDLLVPKISPTFGHGRSAIATDLLGGVGAGTTELHVLRPKPGVSARWLFYVTKTAPFLQEGEATQYGVAGQKRISFDWLKNFHVPKCSEADQYETVRRLDQETSRIDELIDEQSQMIALLWERRRASVFDAVTGRSEGEPRRSGVPWVESIPASWDAVRLTSVASLGSGHTPARHRGELWINCTVPWITTGEVWQIRSDEVEALSATREKISEEGVAESAAVVHPEGTVVLCRTAASAGYSAMMSLDMATSQDFATWTCSEKLAPEYLLYCLRAMRRDLLERLAMGSTHRTIYMPEI
jgi:type I restriction enzyme S subunit